MKKKTSAADVSRGPFIAASVLASPGQPIPPEIEQLIHFSDCFDDTPEFREFLVALKAASSNGTIPTHLEIAKHVNGDNAAWLEIMASSHNPISLEQAAIEAGPLLEKCRSRRIVGVLAEAWQGARDNPDSAGSIALHARDALQFLANGSSHRDGLTFRSPDDLLAMTFDESDRILGDRLLAQGQSLVIAGPGSIGKSRLLLQLAVCCRAGLPFVGFESRGTDATFLILQAENSNRRLQADFSGLREWIGPRHWPHVSAGLVIHTLETDADGFLSLNSETACGRIREAVQKYKPAVVCFDSLYNFAADDLNTDEGMAATLLTMSRLSRAGDPRRAIIILHHSLTGKAAAARATGYDRTSYGRNSKVLHSWTRAQLNVAPGSADDNSRLVLACGKLNDGQPFAPFAVRLNPEKMIYEVDSEFDLSAWQSEVSGKKVELINPEIVRELCGPMMERGALVKAIQSRCGCSRPTAYRQVAKAEGCAKIRLDKKTDCFNPA
jgi:hypothetical protein